MKADSFSRPTARVRDGKLEVRGGWTKREELLKDIVCSLVSTVGPEAARTFQPKTAKAYVDSAEQIVGAFMEHLQTTEGEQYDTLRTKYDQLSIAHKELLHRLEQLERAQPFPGAEQ